jgi:hypothetical protein
MRKKNLVLPQRRHIHYEMLKLSSGTYLVNYLGEQMAWVIQELGLSKSNDIIDT